MHVLHECIYRIYVLSKYKQYLVGTRILLVLIGSISAFVARFGNAFIIISHMVSTFQDALRIRNYVRA